MNQISDLFNRHLFNRRLEERHQRLFCMALGWCNNKYMAEDLAQQTMLKALEKRSQLRDLQAMDKWLYQILANVARDWKRRERVVEALDPHMLVADGDPSGDAARDEIVVRVRKAVAKLPLGQRQALTLVDLEEFSYADVAEILEIPIGTVMSRLSRARQALKKHLDAEAKRRAVLEAAASGPRLAVVK